jgi:hypothetical protein
MKITGNTTSVNRKVSLIKSRPIPKGATLVKGAKHTPKSSGSKFTAPDRIPY